MTELREKLNNIVEEKNTKVTPENLRAGAEAFGVQGTFTADADATAGDIAKGKTAYVNGEKVNGTLELGAGNNNAMIKTMIGSGTSSNSGLNKAVTLINGDFTVDGTSAQYMFYNCTSLVSVGTIDLTNVTDCNYMFYGCYELESVSLKNTDSITNMENMFCACRKLLELPNLDATKPTNMKGAFMNCYVLTEIPTIDTSRCTNMRQMFNNCKALVTVPQLNTSKVTDMYAMFDSNTKLSDESINNILGMCANATSYSGDKTLAYIGLGSLYLTTSRIQNMSNYQAFIDAGWKIS